MSNSQNSEASKCEKKKEYVLLHKMFKFLYNLSGGRCRIMRKYWHIAGKGLIALIYKELSPINKRKINICF